MSEQFPLDQTPELAADQQAELDVESLSAEHRQAAATEVKTLYSAAQDIENLPTSRASESLVQLMKHSNSEVVSAIPGAREATQGVIIGAAKDTSYVDKYFKEVVSKTFADNEPIAKVLANVVNAQASGVAAYDRGPEAITRHRQAFAGSLEGAVSTLNKTEGVDKAVLARATALLRGIQVGSSTPDQRHVFAKKLEETLIQA